MGENELLQAIRQIVKEEITPVKQDVSGMRDDLNGVKQEIAGMKQDISNMKDDLSGVKQDVSNTKDDLTGVKQDVSNMKDDLSGVKHEMAGMKQDITKINIILENDIDRKLSALFDGHKLNTEKMEHISETVDDIEAELLTIDIVSKANVKEISKIKAKIG